MHPRRGFTLIELLVVIAIIAILAVVVVLVLNPAQLLAQSRDANRVSDMATLSSAMNLYQTDLSGAPSYSLGNASSVYISVPDASSTCGDLALSVLPSGDAWTCASSSNYRVASNSGWLPINFQSISAGAPFGSVPVDPVNQTSSGLFYAYNTNGSKYEITANFESSKYKQNYGNNPQITLFPDVVYSGSPNISLLYSSSGLAGYWPLNEGSGSVAIDASGNGNNGAWSGTAIGNGGTYYTGGKVGAYGGDFDGSTDYVNIPNAASLDISGSGSHVTLMAWVYLTQNSNVEWVIRKGIEGYDGSEWGMDIGTGNYVDFRSVEGAGRSERGNTQLSLNQWYFVAATCSNGDTDPIIYVNGIRQSLTITDGSGSQFTFYPTSNAVRIGNSAPNDTANFYGAINDVRVYNRILSPAEVMAIYNAEK